MSPRIKPILKNPILFAHRGGKWDGDAENSLPAFQKSVLAGCSGLESDVRLTSDHIAVLSHNPRSTGKGILKKNIARHKYSDLGSGILSLENLLTNLASQEKDFHISLDIKDLKASQEVVRIFQSLWPEKLDKFWMVHTEIEALAEWRQLWPDIQLVHSTRHSKAAKIGFESHISALVELQVKAINLHCSELTGGITTLAHRFGLLAFSWGANQYREIVEVLEMGADAVYGDFPERLLASFKAVYG